MEPLTVVRGASKFSYPILYICTQNALASRAACTSLAVAKYKIQCKSYNYRCNNKNLRGMAAMESSIITVYISLVTYKLRFRSSSSSRQ